MSGRRRFVGLAMIAMWLAPVCLRAQDPTPTQSEIAKMQAASPDKPRVAPAKAHKLLVFSRSWGYKHTARPFGARAIEVMGKKTGAYEATLIEDDDSLFEPQNIKNFDAIVLNNTNNEIFLPENLDKLPADEQAKARQRDEMLRKTFADYVRNGGGLAVIHAGVASFRTWPEFGDIIGARFENHPWGAGSTVVLKIDEPDHPLTAAFKEPYFIITDEIYQLAAPYSRDNLRVLVTIDLAKTTTSPEQKKLFVRQDGDFAMTYIKTYGQGRVFYNAFGHQHELFWNPIVLQHYLDGIQYVLGDLKADATPSGKIRR